jgi:hypothetical protein
MKDEARPLAWLFNNPPMKDIKARISFGSAASTPAGTRNSILARIGTEAWPASGVAPFIKIIFQEFRGTLVRRPVDGLTRDSGLKVAGLVKETKNGDATECTETSV